MPETQHLTFKKTWISQESFFFFPHIGFSKFQNILQTIVVSSFPSKNHYKTLKKKLFISIKHDLIIYRDMPETRHQTFKKNLD